MPVEKPQIFVVMHENWNAWRVFELCSDQWNLVYLYTAGGGCIPFYQSFNLQSVESAMRCLGIKPRRRGRVLRGVKFIADGAKSILNDR